MNRDLPLLNLRFFSLPLFHLGYFLGLSKSILVPLTVVPYLGYLSVPYLRCPTCNHVNDHDFRYCQLCGYKRKVVSIPDSYPPVDFNLHEIDARLQQLWDFDRATQYSKQKDSLQKDLEVFLRALPGHITLETETPRDLYLPFPRL